MNTALDLTADWPVPNVAAVVLRRGEVLDSTGPLDHRFRLASISKPLVAWTCLIAIEEGTLALDDPIGPDDGTGRTLRHVLAHAGGYGFNDGDRMIPPERKRIYSNAGYEVAAQQLAAASEMTFATYLRLGLLEPLAMSSTELRGSPAYGMWSTVDDLVRFASEVSTPTLISPDTASMAIRPQYPSLGGIVPGVGRFDTCPWGLGFEIRGDKTPHWTGSHNTPTAYGHFGGAGTMMWIDPGHDDLALIALTDRPFDDWADDALKLWPKISDAVIEEYAGTS